MPMRGAARAFLAIARGCEEISVRGIAVNRLAGFPDFGHFFPGVDIGGRESSGRFRMIQLEGELRGRFQGGFELLINGRHFNAHLQRQRLRGHVVRPFGRPARIQTADRDNSGAPAAS